MFFGPEQQQSIQHHREGQVGRPELSESNPIVPNLAFGNKGHTKGAVGQEKLDPFRHVRVEAWWVDQVVHIFASLLKSRHLREYEDSGTEPGVNKAVLPIDNGPML